MKNREQFLMVITGIALAVLIGNWVVLEPLSKLWKTRSDAIVQLRDQVKNGRMMLRRETSIRNRWSLMQTNALPSTASSADLQMSQAFDRWSQSSGVNIESLAPQWENDATNYATLDCRVDATGNLQTLSRFLYQIESDPMAVQVQSVELMARDDQGQQLSLGLELSGLAIISNPQ
ncbi:MAG TPA: GspMb/PilO family protein [Verrucomicrobiae bacterium]